MFKSISHWEKEYWQRKFDIVIIGAGFVGSSTAIYLKEMAPNLSILILEKGVIPYGASTRNAGFACFGSMGELMDDLNHMDASVVYDTVRLRYQGLQRLQSLIETSDMDWQNSGGTEVFRDRDEFESCADQIDVVNKQLHSCFGENVFQIRELKQGGFYKKGIHTAFEGQLNPVLTLEKMHQKIRSLGIHILSGIEVESWEYDESVYNINTGSNIRFQSMNLVLATNAFSARLIQDIPVKAVRNQVLITEPIPSLPWFGNFHFDKGYVYFRNVGDRLLLGGARNISNQEETMEYGTTDEILNHLEDLLKRVILQSDSVTIAHTWSGILGVGTEKAPIIEHLGNKLFAAVRLGGMGVAIGTEVGYRMAKLILN